MSRTTVVLGFGAVGRAVTERLLARGDGVRVAQRSRPADLPAGAAFSACDVLDADSVGQALDGAAQVLLAIGLPYETRVWRTAWPRVMTNVVEAAARTGARVVFIDNLYQLGPQTAPLREDMALTRRRSGKPGVRARITHTWREAADAGRVRFAALRCPDFYGPGVSVSHLGAAAFGRMAKGLSAQLIVPPDMPHDFAYVPDVGRAAVSLLDAPDDDFNQVWNMPCAPTRTAREVLRLGADALGLPLKTSVMPFAVLPVVGLVWRFAGEVADVGFTWNRPYVVDGSKFTGRFWSDITPFETGAPATARSFQDDARPTAAASK